MLAFRICVIAAGMLFLTAPFARAMAAESDEAREAKKAAEQTAQLWHDPASPVLGNQNGDVTIVEFFDYQCPFTKAVEPRLEAFLAKDQGAKLILKDFPILTPESRIAAKAALASVNQGKHDAFHRALLAHKGILEEADIFSIAASVGLDIDRLRRDMNDPAIADHLLTDFNLARQLKIVSTPGFDVNGRVLTEPSAAIDFDKIAASERAAAKR